MRRCKRVVRRLSVCMLLGAILIRLVIQLGLDVRAGQAVREVFSMPGVASFLFYLELGQALPAPETADLASPPRPEKPQPEEPEPVEHPAETEVIVEPEKVPETPETPREKLQFTEADAQGITVAGQCTYPVDKLALLTGESPLDFQQDGPTVLIVHTHTSEAYTQEAGWEYPENDTARTQDPNFSVVRVGEQLAQTLEEHGISVIHDGSFNDYPSYNGAYNRTLQKIQAWLEEYPSIQMVIDVHRDAAANSDGTPMERTCTVEGTSMAQLMLVVGTDQGGLEHPGWRQNLGWALKLQAMLNRQAPGLCRPLDLRTERFNQHMTAGSLLVEVGASGNTLKQAIESARVLGEGLAALIQGS